MLCEDGVQCAGCVGAHLRGYMRNGGGPRASTSADFAERMTEAIGGLMEIQKTIPRQYNNIVTRIEFSPCVPDSF